MYSTLVNYADDNNLCTKDTSVNNVVVTLERDAHTSVEWFTKNYMGSNADKFQAIILGKSPPIDASFCIQGHIINTSRSIKTLGVTFDDKLKFNEHIAGICKRASAQINALKRISKFLNTSGRMNIYKSFIHSNFSYCPLTWMFCGKKNIQKLEKLQERGLRFVFSDHTSTYEALLLKANLLSLSMNRLKLLGIEVYKCVNKLNPEYLNSMFKQRTISYDFRDPLKLELSKFRTTSFGYKSFSYYGAKLWNSLPTEIKNVDSLSKFKENISRWCHSADAQSFVIF